MKKIIVSSAPYIAITLGIVIIIGELLLNQSNEKELEIQIEQIQRKNDLLRWSNELLDSLIVLQRAIVDSMDKEIVITNRFIKKLKNVRYEKIRAIDSMDNNKLLEFFAGFESTSPDN